MIQVNIYALKHTNRFEGLSTLTTQISSEIVNNIDKTRAMTYNLPVVAVEQFWSCTGNCLEIVYDFQYLGSADNNNDFKHLGEFWKLRKCWSSNADVKIKINLFWESILSVLLYGRESWIVYHKLES